MAERAESLNFEPQQGPQPVAEFPKTNQSGPSDSLKNAAAKNYRVMKDRASRSFSVIVQKSSALLTHLKRQIQTTREEYPLRIVAVAGGTAFILGVVLRVWRNQHE